MTYIAQLSGTSPGGDIPWSLLPLAQVPESLTFRDVFTGRIGNFLPSLIGAILLLLVGWIIATVVALGVKNLLKRTNWDDRLANWVMGESPTQDVPIEEWTSTAVYWVIMIFAIVAFLRALNLDVVSEPLNDFLQQIFAYLPRIGGAALLLGIAWAIATMVKAIVTRGLSRFNLDDQLAQQTGGSSPIVMNETIGNVLYWFIFLLFLPLILSALNLPGLLQPVEGLIDQFLQAIPRILTALIVLAIGWLVARISRGIVTNLLAATGADQIGTRVGLAANTQDGVSLSGLVGTIVYVLILIPAAVAALNELDIQAISDPAIQMLEQILTAIPQILMAGLVLVVFYVIGRFVSDLVVSILRGIGFDNIMGILGLPELSVPAAAQAQPTVDAEGQPSTTVQTPSRTPSEVVGLIVLAGIVLFGAVTATEILQFEALTNIVQAILRVSARIISALVVFGVGLYLANLAFRLISAMGTSQARTLAQAARIAVIALVGAMALQQMGVATDIVNLAFGLLLGAIAVAIAIAFGLGGRDIASEQIREWLNNFKQNR